MISFRAFAGGVVLLCLVAEVAQAQQFPFAGRHASQAQLARRFHDPAPHRTGGPVLLSGKLLTKTVIVTKAPGVPSLVLKYDAGKAGLSYVEVELASGTSGQAAFVDWTNPGPATTMAGKGTLTLGNQGYSGSLYAQPGDWHVQSMELYDGAGNETLYDESQLAALFPTVDFTVKNSNTPDIVPPNVAAGQILTPAVTVSSKQPYFGASLTVSDNLSGVVAIYVDLLDPQHEYWEAWDHPPAAIVESGTASAWVWLGGAPTGTWTIAYYFVYDSAGNVTEGNTPDEITALFGTNTFTVNP
ncbi:MAG TPA: hypothetical protein VGM17_12195 [Rhizomicrobium sp.]|jgi:hypothetical protein